MKQLQVTKIENIDALVVSTLTEIEQLEARKKTLGKHISALKKRVSALRALSEGGAESVMLHVASSIETTEYQELYEQDGETQVLDTLWTEPRMLSRFDYAGGIEPLPVEIRDFPSRQHSMFDASGSVLSGEGGEVPGAGVSPRRAVKPRPEDYGWEEPVPSLGQEGGWLLEGGEEAYEAALEKWEAEQAKTSGEV